MLLRKKLTYFLIALSGLLFCCVTAQAIPAPEISAKSALIMDAKTGQILFEKNKEERVYPASVTKVMTVYLAAEKLNAEDIATASRAAVDAVPKDSTNIAIDYDEQLTADQLMAAAMLMSANDACNVLAEAVSGSMESFCSLMNTTAQSFGATATNFKNANGLPDENHYTTALDFAKITRSIIQSSPKFLHYFGMETYTIPQTNKKNEARNFVAKHRMIHMEKYKPLGVMGGKTGYTNASRHTAVTYAQKDGKTFFVVIFGSESLGGMYEEIKSLLEYVYEEFVPITVTGAEIEKKIDGRWHYTPQGSTTFYLKSDMTKNDITYNFAEEKVLISDKAGNLLSSLPLVKEEVVPLHEKIWNVVWKCGVVLIILIIVMLVVRIKKDREKRERRAQKRKKIMQESEIEKVYRK